MKGFTLIELIIVITISLVVVTTGFVGVSDFVKKQSIADDALRLESELKKIHSMAAGVLNPNTNVCDNVVSYDVSLLINTNDIGIVVNCENGGVVDISKTGVLSSAVFESSVSFSLYPPKGSLSAGDAVDVVIKSTNDSTLRRNINYNENGVITITTP